MNSLKSLMGESHDKKGYDSNSNAGEIREDRKLADIIKETHSTLREQVQSISCDLVEKKNEIEDEIWKEHADRRMALESGSLPSNLTHPKPDMCYSSAMQKLADKHWAPNIDTDIEKCSRIKWIKNHINKYLDSDQYKFCERLEKRQYYEKFQTTNGFSKRLKIDRTNKTESKSVVSQILDVGSCHNPFSKEFMDQNVNVTAIDLCPWSESVYKCDFLRVPIVEMDKTYEVCSNRLNHSVTSLKHNGFDVVVFCLLLEYFPSPRLRYQACEKASQLLKNNGLLLIVTPDSSKNQAKNETQMKSWRLAMANIGFLRIYIEKLRHLRCMGFVKVDEESFGSICKEEANKIEKLLTRINTEKVKSDSEIQDFGPKDDHLMFIPQDSTTKEFLEKRNQKIVLK